MTSRYYRQWVKRHFFLAGLGLTWAGPHLAACWLMARRPRIRASGGRLTAIVVDAGCTHCRVCRQTSLFHAQPQNTSSQWVSLSLYGSPVQLNGQTNMAGWSYTLYFSPSFTEYSLKMPFLQKHAIFLYMHSIVTSWRPLHWCRAGEIASNIVLSFMQNLRLDTDQFHHLSLVN